MVNPVTKRSRKLFPHMASSQSTSGASTVVDDDDGDGRTGTILLSAPAHTLSSSDVLKTFGADPLLGLPAQGVPALLARYGVNRFKPPPRDPASSSFVSVRS